MINLREYGLIGCMATCVALSITSCDTREDWFKKEGEGATFIFQSGERIDTIDMAGMTYVDYNVSLNKIENVYKSVIGYSDTLNLMVYGMTNRQTIPTEIGYISVNDGDKNIQTEKNEDGSLNLWYQTGLSGLSLFVSDTSAACLGSTRLMFTLKDIFGNDYYSYVRVNFWGDCPPVPVLSVSDVDSKPLEKVLSMKKSYDKDGSVTKYEYCIDGNIASYKNTDNRLECYSGVWQSGKAAYGGTYITATAIDEVNHAFQSSGEHVIYYRCMDDMGAWSTWKKETITINE